MFGRPSHLSQQEFRAGVGERKQDGVPGLAPKSRARTLRLPPRLRSGLRQDQGMPGARVLNLHRPHGALAGTPHSSRKRRGLNGAPTDTLCNQTPVRSEKFELWVEEIRESLRVGYAHSGNVIPAGCGFQMSIRAECDQIHSVKVQRDIPKRIVEGGYAVEGRG